MNTTVNLIVRVTAALALFGLAACGQGDTGDQLAEVDGAAVCSSGIAQLEAGLDAGEGDANQRTEAESELDEALEARDGADWADCIDALEEAFEAIEMTEAADEMGEALEALGGDDD